MCKPISLSFPGHMVNKTSTIVSRNIVQNVQIVGRSYGKSEFLKRPTVSSTWRSIVLRDSILVLFGIDKMSSNRRSPAEMYRDRVVTSVTAIGTRIFVISAIRSQVVITLAVCLKITINRYTTKRSPGSFI